MKNHIKSAFLGFLICTGNVVAADSAQSPTVDTNALARALKHQESTIGQTFVEKLGDNFAYGLGTGMGNGLGHSIVEPFKVVFAKLANIVVNPGLALKSFKLSMWAMVNNYTFSYDQLVWFEQSINNLVKDSLISFADSNNKVARLKKSVGISDSVSESELDDEVLFAKLRVLDSLNNLKAYFLTVLPTYEGKRGNFSMAVIRPYSVKELELIVFEANQILAYCDYLISMINSIDTTEKLEAKKDSIKRAMKSLTNLFGSLVIVIDPISTFDQARKGLVFSYDGKFKGGAEDNKPKGPQGAI